ncbi:MAG: hypothetical protein ACXQTD_00095 [Candidatus Syntropharchaeia archaeon]
MPEIEHFLSLETYDSDEVFDLFCRATDRLIDAYFRAIDFYIEVWDFRDTEKIRKTMRRDFEHCASAIEEGYRDPADVGVLLAIFVFEKALEEVKNTHKRNITVDDLVDIVNDWRKKGFELFLARTPVGDHPYCPYCGAHEFHAFGWCMKHRRFECVVQRAEEVYRRVLI